MNVNSLELCLALLREADEEDLKQGLKDVIVLLIELGVTLQDGSVLELPSGDEE